MKKLFVLSLCIVALSASDDTGPVPEQVAALVSKTSVAEQAHEGRALSDGACACAERWAKNGSLCVEGVQEWLTEHNLSQAQILVGFGAGFWTRGRIVSLLHGIRIATRR